MVKLLNVKNQNERFHSQFYIDDSNILKYVICCLLVIIYISELYLLNNYWEINV